MPAWLDHSHHFANAMLAKKTWSTDDDDDDDDDDDYLRHRPRHVSFRAY